MSNQSLSENGFTLVEFVLSILVLVVICIAVFYAVTRRSSSTVIVSKPSSSSSLLAEITNSGSTNFSGWDLKIYGNESGDLDCMTGPQRNKSCNSTTFKSGTFPASLKQALAQTNLTSYADRCVRSVSFGSNYTLIYRGISTAGIDCYAENAQTLLAQDLQKVLAKVSS